MLFYLGNCSLVFGDWNVVVWEIDFGVLGMGFGFRKFGFIIW